MLGSYWSPKVWVFACIGSPAGWASASKTCTKTALPQPSLSGAVFAVQAMAKPPSARATISGPVCVPDNPDGTLISAPTGWPEASKILTWCPLPADDNSYQATAMLPLASTVTDDSTEDRLPIEPLITNSPPAAVPSEPMNRPLMSQPDDVPRSVHVTK